VNGVASFSTNSLAVGSHSISANYSGDANFAVVTSSSETELVEDFTLTAGTSSQSIGVGSAATFTFTVAPPTGDTFPAAITLSVTGLPANATYSFSPATLAAGAGSTSVTLTVNVPSTTSMMHPGNDLSRRLAPLALGLLLLPFAGRLRRASKRFNRLLSLLVLLGLTLVAATGLSGCGGAVAASHPPQSYTVTVTGTSGALSHSTTMTLNVN
jgi:hypothetical protein